MQNVIKLSDIPAVLYITCTCIYSKLNSNYIVNYIYANDSRRLMLT